MPGGVMRLGSDSPFYAWLKLDRLQGKVIPITTANVATADGDSLRPFFGYVLPPPIFFLYKAPLAAPIAHEDAFVFL